MKLNEKIKYLRKINKLTQQEVAKAIGTSAPNFSRYESGERNFTIEHIKKLATFFNVSITYLLDIDDKEEILINKKQFEILIEAKNVIEELEKSLKG